AVRTSTTTARRGRRPAVGHLKWIMACLSFLESAKMPTAALRPPPPAGARNGLADATAKRSPWLGLGPPSIPNAHHARGLRVLRTRYASNDFARAPSSIDACCAGLRTC